METRLVHVPEGLALVIDPVLVDHLDWEEGEAVEVKVEGTQLIVTPVRVKRRVCFEDALRQTIEEYGDVLRRLAD